jgi:hypothetical protein
MIVAAHAGVRADAYSSSYVKLMNAVSAELAAINVGDGSSTTTASNSLTPAPYQRSGSWPTSEKAPVAVS